MNARKTKYTYGQFALIHGKRYRVRKAKITINACKQCVLYEKRKCKIMMWPCVLQIPIDAYLEKV